MASPATVTRLEAAEILGVSDRTLYRILDRIPVFPFKVGERGTILYLKRDIIALKKQISKNQRNASTTKTQGTLNSTEVETY